jgi:hypothetical protein
MQGAPVTLTNYLTRFGFVINVDATKLACTTANNANNPRGLFAFGST